MTNENQKKQKASKKRKPLPKWARILLTIGKILLVPMLCVTAIIAGMIIGYVYVGNEELSDVFKFDTWRHLFDLVYKDS